jgi:hypothetical protein
LHRPVIITPLVHRSVTTPRVKAFASHSACLADSLYLRKVTWI